MFQIEQLEDRVVLDHSHILIDYIGNKIVIEPSAYGLVFAGEVDTEGGGFTLDPSITNSPSGNLTPGSVISITALGPVMVHNGTSFVSAGSAYVSFIIPTGPTVTGSSGEQSPFAYGNVAGDGTMHVHPLIEVFSPIDAAVGIELQLSTNTPGIEDSDTFWLVYNYNLSSTAMNVALTAFASLGGVTAEAGGPYVGTEGSPVALSGSGTGTISLYEWDLDNDGQYDDAVGQDVNFTATDNGVYQVGLRVTGPSGSSTDIATVTIANAAPTTAIAAPATGVRGQTRTFVLTATDPSAADQAANFTFQIDWDGNGSVDQTVIGASGISVDHVFATSNTYNVKVRATDKDSGVGSFTTKSITILDWEKQTDTQDPSKTNLVWGGTSGVDAYAFVPGFVLIQAQNNQFFPASLVVAVGGYNGKLIVFGQAMPDLIFADVSNLPVYFDGGDGDDVLVGGRAGDTLLGGAGNDILFGGTLSTDGNDLINGGSGDDLLFGHYGADTIYGGSGSDLILAARVSFDLNLSAAAYAIQAEWQSARPLAQKVANISGTGSPDRNNSGYFLQPAVTVFDDGEVDQIFGDGDNDWILYDFAEDLAPDVTAGDLTTNIG